MFPVTFLAYRRATCAAVVFVSLVGPCVPASAAETLPARRWTDAASGRTIEAQFLGVSDGKIRLRTSDGKVWELPPERLIQIDRDYVQQATAATKPARLKLFTDKRTGQSVTGYVVRRENADGHIRLLVRTEDDQEIWLFSAQCEITDADQSQPDGASGGALANSLGRAPLSSDDATRTVVAEGVGLTPEEALKDAFRSAVRQVVGEVVDAETLVKDDQLVKDQVLTYSDAYIPKHTKISERSEGGLFRITIRAVVERRKLVVKLKAANVALKGVDGQSVFGNIVSQLENEKDAAALLRNALEGFPQNCITAEVVGEPKILQKDDQKATLRFEVQVRPDLKAYKTFATRLQRTLQSVASNNGEITQTLQREVDRNWPGFDYFIYTTSGNVESNPALRKVFYQFLPVMDNLADPTQREFDFRSDVFAVAVATQNAQVDRLTFKYFVLPSHLKSCFVDAANLVGQAEITLCDSEGENVAVDEFALSQSHPTWESKKFAGSLIKSVSFRGTQALFDYPLNARTKGLLFLIIPMFSWNDEPQQHRPALSIARDITLTLDEIKTVNKVKCEIHFD